MKIFLINSFYLKNNLKENFQFNVIKLYLITDDRFVELLHLVG